MNNYRNSMVNLVKYMDIKTYCNLVFSFCNFDHLIIFDIHIGLLEIQDLNQYPQR
jgi:hypothetical protein